MYQTFIKPLVADVKNFFLDTLFPITCLSCEKEGAFLCSECSGNLQKVNFQKCIFCRKPSPLGLTHFGCQTAYGPDGLVSFFDYRDDVVSKTVINGKYYFLPGVFETLGKLTATQIETREYKNLFEGFAFVPIPLATSRKRWRGFNQAEVLCKTLGDELGFPVVDALVRQKATKTQKDLKRDERIKNVDGAFALARQFKGQIQNQNFILVDDVTTTGSTLLEAVKVLKRNGAAKIWCLTVAKD